MNILMLLFMIQMIGLYAMLLLIDYVYEPGSKYLADQKLERKAAAVKVSSAAEPYRKAS